MQLNVRPAALEDAAFLATVVIEATQAQGRFPPDFDEQEFRSGFEEWSRETVLGGVPHCFLGVIQLGGNPVGRLRIVRDGTSIVLAGIQLLPAFQNQGIGTQLIEQLKREADAQALPLLISVEKDNPGARRLYERMGCGLIGESEREYQLRYSPTDRADGTPARLT